MKDQRFGNLLIEGLGKVRHRADGEFFPVHLDSLEYSLSFLKLLKPAYF